MLTSAKKCVFPRFDHTLLLAPVVLKAMKYTYKNVNRFTPAQLPLAKRVYLGVLKRLKLFDAEYMNRWVKSGVSFWLAIHFF